MRNIATKTLFCLCFAATIHVQAQYQSKESIRPLTRILFIFDASQSMLGEWESGQKIDIARRFLMETVDSLQGNTNVQMALRVYGHQSPVPPQDCSDTRLEVPFGPVNGPRIKQKLKYLRPKGTTPLARSLGLAKDDFPPCNNCRNIVILITDGIEACEGDPCQISRELQKNGIILKPFVIGIGLSESFTNSFDCIGEYYNASDEKSFQETLNIVISHALNPTTVQVNLLDERGNPTETNVNMTFFDQYSGQIKYNYMHTINNRGVPDTVELDHLLSYRMVVNTIPPVEVDSISLTPGKHTIIAAETPQGNLIVKSVGNEFYGTRFIVRKPGDPTTLNAQLMYEEERYLTGYYNLEVLTYPRLYIDSVIIKQSETTSINIPRPGLANFHKKAEGYGSVYKKKEDGSLEWVKNLADYKKDESVYLLPGNYLAVFRSKDNRHTFYTITRNFRLTPGANVNINLHF